MNFRICVVFKLFIVFSLIFFILSCAKPYHLSVSYHLPEEPQQLAGQKVQLVVEDQRGDKEIFSEKAMKEFDKWDGTYALALGGTPPPEPVQTYDLPALFHEALKERLETMQIEVVDASSGDAPTLTVTLEKVAVDLKGKTWHSEITYRAKLSRDSSKIARETVTGKAERTKIMGMGGGEKLAGELFTDVINKLNLPKLFENAGLL